MLQASLSATEQNGLERQEPGANERGQDDAALHCLHTCPGPGTGLSSCQGMGRSMCACPGMGRNVGHTQAWDVAWGHALAWDVA